MALYSSVSESHEQWRLALSRACESFEPTDIHAFRVASKRLRYRIELARDLGDGEARAVLVSLKTLQDELGRWHDRLDLGALATEALANPQLLLAHSRAASAVRRKLARDNATQSERVRRLLINTRDAAGQFPIEVWVRRNCGKGRVLEAASP
jgi:CHAD domain-containing protein